MDTIESKAFNKSKKLILSIRPQQFVQRGKEHVLQLLTICITFLTLWFFFLGLKKIRQNLRRYLNIEDDSVKWIESMNKYCEEQLFAFAKIYTFTFFSCFNKNSSQLFIVHVQPSLFRLKALDITYSNNIIFIKKIII